MARLLCQNAVMSVGFARHCAAQSHASRGSSPLTRPPGFMPMTAVEMAGGGLGPEPPANSPPAESLAFLA